MGGWLKVMALAVVQGLTEFLPVSSSGHLVIGKRLLGLDSPGVRLEVVLHLGTLVAVCAYFWRRLWSLALGALKRERQAWVVIGLLALASIPAVVFFKLAGKPLKGVMENPVFAACGLLATGAMLLSLRWAGEGEKNMAWWRALLMGMGQAVAILPGVSRMGTTTMLARHSGVNRREAGEFAMLMSIPVILGAALADALGAELGGAESAVTPAMHVVGAVVSAGVGYAAVAVFMRVLDSAWFWVFGVYCLAAGCVALAVL